MVKPLKKRAPAGLVKAGSESRIEQESGIATTGRGDGNAAKPVSLAPLSFEEALVNLLKVAPTRKRAVPR